MMFIESKFVFSIMPINIYMARSLIENSGQSNLSLCVMLHGLEWYCACPRNRSEINSSTMTTLVAGDEEVSTF